VHDDRAVVEARLRRVMDERVRPALRSARRPLEVEAWDVPGEPVPVGEALAATYRPFAVGAPWGRPWGTTWFRLRGRVPDEWRGRRVEAVVNLGFTNAPGFQAEGMLWGPDPGGADRWVPLRGLHPFNHDIAVADPAAGGEVVDLLVEAAANPTLTDHRPNPSSDLLTSGDAPIYSLARAELVVVEADVVELREDVRTLTELMAELPLDQPRRHEILRALERMLDTLVLDDVAGTAVAARAELIDVLARPAVPSAHRLSAIGHAHIDSAWLWPIRETRRKCARTFSNVLSLMDDHPELVFACSQAAQYEWMRDEYPSVFEGIVERTAEGRWVPVGGMWVEPDANLAGGEALVRQITHGQRFFTEHLGRRSTEVWIPDVFGYPAALPQIMRLGGIDRFLTQKMSWNKTNRFPHHTFWWEGIDGSTVFTHFPPIDSYNALFKPMMLNHAVENFSEKGRATRSLMPFGFGNGGGGPNRQMLQQFRRVRDLEGLPRIEMESPEAFFDAAIAEYPDAPRWVGELYFETHRGTFTSQAKTKAGNRRCELLLREAELWCTAAYGTSSEAGYPTAALDRIWKTVLLHQFHDILPGSSIGWVHREAEATYLELIDQLTTIIDDAVELLAADAPRIANAAPHDRDEVVVFTAAAAPFASPTTDGTGAGLDGSSPDVQVLADGVSIAARIRVPAMATAPLVPAAPDDAVTYDADERVLANAHLAVAFDDDGLVRSIRHLGSGREVLAPGRRANLLQLHPDLPNEYDAWDLDDFYRRQVDDLVALDRFEVVEVGPLVGRVRVTRSFRSSSVVQVVELRAGSSRLDVHTDVEWHERDHVLKVSFPVDVHADHLTREIQFGHLATAIHTNTSWDAARFEVCAHRWVDVAEPGFGVALLNDAKYGHDASRIRTATDTTATDLRLTLLKGAQYPDPHADEGHHAFTYALVPHTGSFRDAGIIEEGYRLNIAPRVIPARAAAPSTTDGAGADDVAAVDHVLVRSSNPAVVVEAVKPADDGSGDLVVRLYESWGSRSSFELELAAPPSTVAVVDLLEEPNPTIPAVDLAVRDRAVLGELRPFQILTLRIAAA
jgi:alpha-mannosidase